MPGKTNHVGNKQLEQVYWIIIFKNIHFLCFSTIGGPRGLYFNLGDSEGDSESMFWFALYPRRIRVNRNRSFMVYSKGFLHLYTNPTARKHWCDKNGELFVMPLPTQQPSPIGYTTPQQHLPGYSVQQLPGHSLQQHQDPVYSVPHHHINGESYSYNQEEHRRDMHEYHHQVDQGNHLHHEHGHMNHGFN